MGVIFRKIIFFGSMTQERKTETKRERQKQKEKDWRQVHILRIFLNHVILL